ncbi:hypothetical protein PSTEL_01535 [Paenibacillus stellifer]|uniref:Uncharacterized protein n=1 Tax=Paenibacillus stellifer TaxID=169760 RepID=A0A089LPI4_9BACL|nr:hypothetical protein PSTEL_01535 [Paenibacillus stellifer]
MQPFAGREAPAGVHRQIPAGGQRAAQIAGQEQIGPLFALAEIEEALPHARSPAQINPGRYRHARVIAYTLQQISRQLKIG